MDEGRFAELQLQRALFIARKAVVLARVLLQQAEEMGESKKEELARRSGWIDQELEMCRNS